MPRKISVKKPSKFGAATKSASVPQAKPSPMPLEDFSMPMETPMASGSNMEIAPPKKPARRVYFLWALFAFLLALGMLIMAYMVYLTKVNMTYVLEENKTLREAVRLVQLGTSLPTASSGTMTTVDGLSGEVLSSELAKAQSLEDTVLKGLSVDWQNDAELSRGVDDPIYQKFVYPNDLDKDFGNVLPPKNGSAFLSIPSNKGDEFLRVFLTCKDALAETEAPVCGGWEVELWVFDTKSGNSTYVAKLQEFHGSNFGYLPIPVAWSKDDKLIILKDLMYSPGAGGSSVTSAYRTVDVSKGNNANEQKPVFLATESAEFYDTYGKVIYLDQGEKSVKYLQPGPSNNSKMVYKNILGGQTKVLLEDADTEYELMGIDAEKNVETYKATKYTFDDKCPRADGNQNCAKKETVETEIELP